MSNDDDELMVSRRVQRSNAALLVIDIQEKLLPAIFAKERLLENALRLIHGFSALQVPVLVTEQYRKGLGSTVADIASAIPGFSPVEKLAFSACGAESVLKRFKERRTSDVILCGIEAHVCVSQTCLDLLDAGFRVFVVADAIASRTEENRQIGIDRMRLAGAIIVSTEMILFELVQFAGTDEFKKILALVK